jgi:hypothetical protein
MLIPAGLIHPAAAERRGSRGNRGTLLEAASASTDRNSTTSSAGIVSARSGCTRRHNLPIAHVTRSHAAVASNGTTVVAAADVNAVSSESMSPSLGPACPGVLAPHA